MAALMERSRLRCSSTSLKMPMLLQHFNDTWQEWDQTFGADPVERLPGQHQGLFDLWPIPPTKISGSLEDLLGMVEQPPGIFACVPCGAHKVFQDLLLLGRQCSEISRRNLPEQDSPGLCPQSVSHVFLLNLTANQRSHATDLFPLAS